MNPICESSRNRRPEPCLTFSAIAWLKLQYFCHAGRTEIGGFGISAYDNPLYVADFQTVGQHTSPDLCFLDDVEVADFTDRCVDQGLPPERFLRIWLHTHPGSCARPSPVDEETFYRVFGGCDWAVMFILSRFGETFARLSFNVGPAAMAKIPMAVDWSSWAKALAQPEQSLDKLHTAWQAEYARNIHPLPETKSTHHELLDDSFGTSSPDVMFLATEEELHQLESLLKEDHKRHVTNGPWIRL